MSTIRQTIFAAVIDADKVAYTQENENREAFVVNQGTKSALPKLKTVNTTLTRPTGADAYAAKDVVSDSTTTPTVLTFTDVAKEVGGTGLLLKARFMTNQATCVSKFRLHLYNTAPTAVNDNAPFALLYANADKRIGFVEFIACTTEGTGSDSASSLATSATSISIPLTFNCASGSKNLYGILETIDGFTPASAQTFFVELSVEQN